MAVPLHIIENIKTCHACIRGMGRTTCPDDGLDVGRHAEKGDCPRGLHVKCEDEIPMRSRFAEIPLPGDLIEALAKRIGADRLAKLWERWTGKPCGCKERQEKMNNAARRLMRWLGR